MREPALRPPPDLSASDLVTRWLPEFCERERVSIGPDMPVLRLSLAGPGGGDFVIRADGPALMVRTIMSPARGRPPTDVHDVSVWIRLPAADLLAALRGDADLPPLLPADRSLHDLLFLDAPGIETVRRLSGRIAVEITGRRRRRFVLDAAFGAAGLAAGRPRATIRLGAVTADELARGLLAPLQALLGGRIAIVGDRPLAMQFLLLLGVRLAPGAA